MTHDEIIASRVPLTTAIECHDLKPTPRVLKTVGDAAEFLHTQFTAVRSRDLDWKLAASTLQHAAETADEAAIGTATGAVILLLKNERLYDGE